MSLSTMRPRSSIETGDDDDESPVKRQQRIAQSLFFDSMVQLKNEHRAISRQEKYSPILRTLAMTGLSIASIGLTCIGFNKSNRTATSFAGIAAAGVLTLAAMPHFGHVHAAGCYKKGSKEELLSSAFVAYFCAPGEPQDRFRKNSVPKEGRVRASTFVPTGKDKEEILKLVANYPQHKAWFETTIEESKWRSARYMFIRVKLGVGSQNNLDKAAKSKTVKQDEAVRVGGGPAAWFDNVSLPTLSLWIETMEGLRDGTITDPSHIPPEVRDFIPYRNMERAKRLARWDYHSIMAYGDDKLGSWSGIQPRHILEMTPQELDDKVDEEMNTAYHDEDSGTLGYSHEGNIRKWTGQNTLEVSQNIAQALYDGRLGALPFLLNKADDLESTKVSWIVFSVGASTRSNLVLRVKMFFKKGYQKVLNLWNERRVLVVPRTTCPGQSNNHYGSQGSNIHPLPVSAQIMYSPTGAVVFNTDNPPEHPKPYIKNKEHRESELYTGVATKISGEDRMIRRMYESAEQVTKKSGLTLYVLTLPLMEFTADKKRKREALGQIHGDNNAAAPSDEPQYSCQGYSKKKVKQHRVTNLLAIHAGLHDPTALGQIHLGNSTSWEAKYLLTGESQAAEDLDEEAIINALLTKFDMTRDDIEGVGDEDDELNVPQGQCDIDHCNHRNHPISNSIYFCYPVSHTANTLNSIVRQKRGDWCLVLNHEVYNGGN